jgi:hypothetical protein
MLTRRHKELRTFSKTTIFDDSREILKLLPRECGINRDVRWD